MALRIAETTVFETKRAFLLQAEKETPFFHFTESKISAAQHILSQSSGTVSAE